MQGILLLPIANETYHFALMVTVDCFLNDIMQAFKEVWRILSEDGYFIIKHSGNFYKHTTFHSAEEIEKYLDYNATTPIDKEVVDAMLPYLYGNFGNPSSSHELGVAAKNAVEHARRQVAKLLNCSPEEIIFTSGGSESNNTVIKGVAHTYKNKGNHIITSQIEHPAIINPCKYLEKIGYEISYLPVDKYGIVNLSDVEKLITDKTILITVMHSNNETGTLQPIEEISEIS